MVYTSKRSIEDFKSNLANGGVRPTMFEVQITFPQIISGGADNNNSARGDNNEFSNKSIFLVKGATLPGSQIGVINVPFRGRKLKVSGDRTFADWETTIFSDTDYRLRNAIEKWAEHVQNHNYALGHNQLQDGTGVGGNNGANLGYMGTAIVRQLDRQGQQLKMYQFNGIWPIQIGDIALDFGTNDTVAEYSCTWAVQYWHGAGPDADDIKGREIAAANASATPVAGSLLKTVS